MSGVYRLLRVTSARRRFQRMRRILAVLARHGFGDVAQRLGLASAWRRITRLFLLVRRGDGDTGLSMGQRLRRVCEDLGPTFIKLGQVLANRPDLLPLDVVTELAKLQDDVPPFEFEAVRETLERELGGDLDKVFENLDPQPLAAASIGQVHRGRLKDGREVAVKIRRPGIRRLVGEDLSLLTGLAEYLHSTIPELRRFDLPGFVREFGRTLKAEMDFVGELQNLNRFREIFSQDDRIVVPEAYPEFCTSSVLVMEFITGWKITDVKSWTDAGIEPATLAELGTSVMLRSIFEHRFFHADPHPGNFFVLPDGRICLLDFGMMGHVDEQRLDEMLTFMVGVLSGDTDMIVDLFVDADLVPETTDLRALRRDLQMIMDRFLHLRLEDLDMQVLIDTVIGTIVRHDVSPPADLLLIGRALSTMEGIAKMIYPEYCPMEAIRPYLTAHFLKRMMDPTQRAQEAYNTLSEYAGLLRRLPRDLKTILRRARKGQLEFRVSLAGEEARERRRERTANRAILAGLSSVAFISAVVMEVTSTSIPDWMIHSTLVVGSITFMGVLWSIRKNSGI